MRLLIANLHPGSLAAAIADDDVIAATEDGHLAREPQAPDVFAGGPKAVEDLAVLVENLMKSK